MDYSGRFLLVSVISFAIGIAFRSLVHVGVLWVVFLGMLGGVLFLYARMAHSLIPLFVAASCFFLALGIGRFILADQPVRSEVLDAFVNEEHVFQGVVVSEPRVTTTREHITVAITQPHEARIRVTKERFPALTYGDKVELIGALVLPSDFETETGRTFQYTKFLAKDDIGYQMFFPKLTVLSQEHGNALVSLLLRIKHTFVESVSQLLPEPHAALLAGLVVGAQEGLGEALLDDFRIVGLIHIVVLSGYNITIVAEAIMRLFGFLRKRLQLWLASIAIILFAILVGLGATVVRASIMAGLVLLARGIGRTYNITRALLVAGCIMLIIKPHILMFDPSFQLSFLATLGLIYVAPLLERFFLFIPERFQLRELVTATIATQLFVLPLLLYSMGTLSLVSVVVNILVLPIIPLTMLLGFIAGMAGMVMHFFALPFAFGAYLLLSYELFVVAIAQKVPFAAITIPPISVFSMVFLYVGIVGILWVLHHKNTA